VFDKEQEVTSKEKTVEGKEKVIEDKEKKNYDELVRHNQTMNLANQVRK